MVLLAIHDTGRRVSNYRYNTHLTYQAMKGQTRYDQQFAIGSGDYPIGTASAERLLYSYRPPNQARLPANGGAVHDPHPDHVQDADAPPPPRRPARAKPYHDHRERRLPNEYMIRDGSFLDTPSHMRALKKLNENIRVKAVGRDLLNGPATALLNPQGGRPQ